MKISNLFLTLYGYINRTGILKIKWIQSLFVFSYFLYKKHLEDTNAKLIKNYPSLFKNGHILDIGANIGYTSYIFAKNITPSYRVYAFEPELRNVNIFKKAAKVYQFEDNVTITSAAVGDQEGEIEIWQNDNHHADHRVLTPELKKHLKGNPNIQKTPLMTIDHFLKTQNAAQPISFIKIDVQGYELAVCRGMIKTLDANPNCVVSFEYCPSIMTELGYRAEELIQFFREKNYFLYRITKTGKLHPLNLMSNKEIDLLKKFGDYFDILCSKKDLVLN